MRLGPFYPTDAHRRAAETVVEHLAAQPEVEAVLLVNSCARGKATPDSCLDMVALVSSLASAGDWQRWEARWKAFCENQPVFRQLKSTGLYSNMELDFINGEFHPSAHYFVGGPDAFELQIGNFLAYSVPLWERGDLYRRLKGQWLPYYGDDLRRERLAMVRYYCLNNLDHIPPFAARGLYFQCFNRLYDAEREFLQALFITRRVYPIAYDKWIHEQIVDLLGLPDLYRALVALLQIERLEDAGLWHAKAQTLRRLLDDYAAPLDDVAAPLDDVAAE